MGQDKKPDKFSESGDSLTVEQIDNHLSKFFKDDEISVYHEIVSDKIHVDIYMIKSNEERDYNILMTSGMSSLPMNTPEELKRLAYAEIVTILPKNWPLDQKDFDNEDNYWPIRQLKALARFPHLNNTWLGVGHTVTNGDPPEPMADNNSFVGSIFLPSITLPEDFMTIEAKDKTIYIYSMIPLYQEEMDYKLKHGTDKLLQKFEQSNINEIIDTNRINTCKKDIKSFR